MDETLASKGFTSPAEPQTIASVILYWNPKLNPMVEIEQELAWKN